MSHASLKGAPVAGYPAVRDAGTSYLRYSWHLWLDALQCEALLLGPHIHIHIYVYTRSPCPDCLMHPAAAALLVGSLQVEGVSGVRVGEKRGSGLLPGLTVQLPHCLTCRIARRLSIACCELSWNRFTAAQDTGPDPPNRLPDILGAYHASENSHMHYSPDLTSALGPNMRCFELAGDKNVFKNDLNHRGLSPGAQAANLALGFEIHCAAPCPQQTSDPILVTRAPQNELGYPVLSLHLTKHTAHCPSPMHTSLDSLMLQLQPILTPRSRAINAHTPEQLAAADPAGLTYTPE